MLLEKIDELIKKNKDNEEKYGKSSDVSDQVISHIYRNAMFDLMDLRKIAE